MAGKSNDKPKRNEYKGIQFAEGYNKSLKEFKEEFSKVHIFKNMPPEDREKALKDAHKIATSNHGNTTTAIGTGEIDK